MEHKDNAKNRGANPLRYLFQKTWHYSAGNRMKIVWYWIMFIMANTISLVCYPLLMRKIMDVVQKEGVTHANFGLLLELLVLTLVTELAFWAFHGPARLIEQMNAFKARTNYRKYLLGGVMTLPMDWHVEHHSGDTIDKVNKGATALFQFSEDSFQVIFAVVQLTVSYSMLVYFSRSAAYIVLVMILVTAWITMRFDRVLIDQYRELSRAENNLSESVTDAITNITTVIILRVERLVFKAIIRKVEKPYELFKENNRANEIKWFLTNVCCNVMVVLVLGAYFWRNIGIAQGILMGNLYILIQYLGKISELFFKFTSEYGKILQRRANVMNAEELAADFEAENFANHVLSADWRELRIDGLNFSYHVGEGADLHLKNLSLSVTRGERIALVGESGGGKTTILKVMRDIHHPRNITLSVDGEIIPQGFKGIARAITLVPQDAEIFASTIFENITLGAEYDLAFVRRFTDMACLTDVIEKLPRKFDSLIKEKGVNLSGGQQQRLALARGLLACHDKDIVLLDEPTSSVDSANEIRIHQNIFRAFIGKTIISSTHRLHLLPLFHRICFVSDGQIIASGSLNELLTTCTEFQKLWKQYHERRDEAIEK